MASLLVPWLLAAACAGSKDVAAAPAETDPDADTRTDTQTDTGERPSILTADAWCYFHKTGEQFYNWDAAASVEDPQGADSVTGGTLLVLQGGAEVVTHLLACNADSARCTTTFQEDSEGVLCADAPTYTFQFIVVDEDGNLSAPVEVTGRAQ